MNHATNPRLDANLKWLFTELPFERRFDAAAAAGFRGVEYAAPYPYPAETLRRLLTNAGLVQVLINTPTPSGPADALGRSREFRAGLDRALDYAGALGSELVHVVAGVAPATVSFERAFDQYVTNLAWAAERAAGTDVRLVVEAQNSGDSPGFLLDSTERAVAAVDAVGSERVGLLLDLYHAHLDTPDVLTTLRSQLPRTFHLQVADPPARTEPGTGQIPWADAFEAVRDYDYAGWVGCEYRPRNGTVAGLDWIARVMA